MIFVFFFSLSSLLDLFRKEIPTILSKGNNNIRYNLIGKQKRIAQLKTITPPYFPLRFSLITQNPSDSLRIPELPVPTHPAVANPSQLILQKERERERK